MLLIYWVPQFHCYQFFTNANSLWAKWISAANSGVSPRVIARREQS